VFHSATGGKRYGFTRTYIFKYVYTRTQYICTQILTYMNIYKRTRALVGNNLVGDEQVVGTHGATGRWGDCVPCGLLLAAPVPGLRARLLADTALAHSVPRSVRAEAAQLAPAVQGLAPSFCSHSRPHVRAESRRGQEAAQV
jgi:hypothetical protein